MLHVVQVCPTCSHSQPNPGSRQTLEPGAQGILSGAPMQEQTEIDDLSDVDLLAQLGMADDQTGLAKPRHVRSASERREAEDRANRGRRADFAE